MLILVFFILCNIIVLLRNLALNLQAHQIWTEFGAILTKDFLEGIRWRVKSLGRSYWRIRVLIQFVSLVLIYIVAKMYIFSLVSAALTFLGKNFDQASV